MNGIHIECECPEVGHYYTCPCALMLAAKQLLEALRDSYFSLDGDYINIKPERHNEIYRLISEFKEVV